MKRKFSGSAVPRHYIFVLQDGTYVVQWAERRVQDILSGDVLPFSYDQYGHSITDGELNKLKGAGRVEHFTRRFVWLFALPERHRYEKPLKTLGRPANSVRAFYIATTLPKSQLENLETLLGGQQLPLSAIRRDDIIAIFDAEGNPFTTFQQAEDVLRQLLDIDRIIFQGAAVAVLEMRVDSEKQIALPFEENAENLDLNTVIESQTDVSLTEGNIAVVIGQRTDEERLTLYKLLVENLKMEAAFCETGQEAIPVLEDLRPEVLIMDLELPDIHGWAFIKNLREVDILRNICIIVVSQDPQDAVFALKVARVTSYLPRPLNMRHLREKIWYALRDQMPVEK